MTVPHMAQARTEDFLGRCILTPQSSKPKPTARRTGILWSAGHDRTTGTAATLSARSQYVAPIASMVSRPARDDHNTVSLYAGKGKERATLPVTTSTSASTSGDDRNSESTPILTSDVLTDSQKRSQEDARRFQAQVDRLERRRDREDTDFVVPNDTSRTQALDEDKETPRTKSRRTFNDSALRMPALAQDQKKQHTAHISALPKITQQTSVSTVRQMPTERSPAQKTPTHQMPSRPRPVQQGSAQQKSKQHDPTPTRSNNQMLVQPQAQQHEQQQDQPQKVSRFQLSVPQKRKADTDTPSHVRQGSPDTTDETMSGADDTTSGDVQLCQKRRVYSVRHNNKRFAMLKPISQTRRSEAVKSIRKTWDITEDELMQLPYAPKHREDSQSVKMPLNWNTKLLEAVALLAQSTKGDFSRGCAIAKEAFGRFNSAKQLTEELVMSAIASQRPVDGSGQKIGGVTSVQQSANDRRQNTTHAKLPQSPETVEPPAAATAAMQILPSPITSPETAHAALAAQGIKSEEAIPTMQQGLATHNVDDYSDSEELLNLKSKERILESELAIVREQIAMKDRKERRRARRAARTKQIGASADEPLHV